MSYEEDDEDLYDRMDEEEEGGNWVHANAPASLNGLRACIPW